MTWLIIGWTAPFGTPHFTVICHTEEDFTSETVQKCAHGLKRIILGAVSARLNSTPMCSPIFRAFTNSCFVITLTFPNGLAFHSTAHQLVVPEYYLPPRVIPDRSADKRLLP